MDGTIINTITPIVTCIGMVFNFVILVKVMNNDLRHVQEALKTLITDFKNHVEKMEKLCERVSFLEGKIKTRKR